MSANSTRKRPSRKAANRPKKPYPDFPLTPHATGCWQKKINGRVRYFGRWARMVNGQLVRIEGDGWKEALEIYKAQANDLHADRPVRVKCDGLTVMELCNRFLTAKMHQLEAGEIGARMFQEYNATTDRLVGTFGKRMVEDLTAEDFEALRAGLARQYGPTRLSNEITRVKSVFKYGMGNGLIEKAVLYGEGFKKPGMGVLRRHRAKNGKAMLEADELRKMIEAAEVPLKAMVLLAINAGFGNHDVATLPMKALDLDRGWVNFPRPKTGIDRRCPLWPETSQALKVAIKQRPAPDDPEDADLVFLLRSGRRWVRNTEKSRTDALAVHFSDLMKKVGIHRPQIGFYFLRHVHRTIADAARDPVACDLIMGHSDPTMGGHYRERVEDVRLLAVVEHVRGWLFGQDRSGTATETAERPQAKRQPIRQTTRRAKARQELRLFAG